MPDDIHGVWEQHDREHRGTPYWDHITSDENTALRDALIALLSRYPIERSGKELILAPDACVRLIDELTGLGVAVEGYTGWCRTVGSTWEDVREKAQINCPYSYGGPARKTQTGYIWFREYADIGIFLEQSLLIELDAPQRCNPIIRNHILNDLPKHPNFTDNVYVTPYLHIPLMWELFPDSGMDMGWPL